MVVNLVINCFICLIMLIFLLLLFDINGKRD